MCLGVRGRKEADGLRTVVVDLAISIDVCLTDHFVDFLIRELLAYSQRVIANE
jgi:hypothetical protein